MAPLPNASRIFASADEFAAFLVTGLNAIPVRDDLGNVVAAEGFLLRIGDAYYVDANNTLHVADDPLSAYIGGLAGTFSVAGVEYSTPLQGQTSAASAPKSVLQCSVDGQNCILSKSYYENPLYCFGMCKTAGTEVLQFKGGYKESLDICWKWGFIPYPCVRSTGSNVLYLAGAIFADSSGSPRLAAYQEWAGFVNTEKVTFEAYQVPFIGGPSQPPLVGLPPVGACGKHGADGIHSTGATADGTVIDSNCFGGGITCTTPGETLCVPVCVNLMTDARFCGSCSNACPSGWSCNNGTCKAPPAPPPPPPRQCRSGYIFCDPGCVKPPQVCP